MQRFIVRNRYFIFLFLIACAGYWQVAFFQNTLKYDAINQYYPWRMFTVDCLRNHILPLWNPYEQFGYPFHADPQSSAWYPIVWLFALIGRYTLYSLQAEFMLHILLAGAGMMILLKSFGVEEKIAFLLACSYMLCGFFTGNAQHVTFIAAGCWTPFVFFSYKKLIREKKILNGIWFTLFCYLLISGGYPAFTIIVFYILLIAFLIQSCIYLKNKELKNFLALMRCNLLTLLLISALSAVVLVSTFSSQEYFMRSSGVSYELASHGPFPPKALMSLLLPLASVKNPVMMQTDSSMSTIYIGLIALAGVFISLFRKKNFTEKLLWLASIILLLAAFGDATPVRKWMYSYLPLMNLFRFPAVFRLFVIQGLLILAGIAFSHLDDLKKLRLPVYGILFFSSAIALVFLFSDSVSFTFNNQAILSFNNSILLQAVIQSIFLVLILIVVFAVKLHNSRLNCIILLSIADIICAAQFVIPVNVIHRSKTIRSASLIQKRFPGNFIIPRLRASYLNSDSVSAPAPLSQNLGIFSRQPSWDGYNSFQLVEYVHFFDYTAFRDKIIKNPWAYFADSVLFYEKEIYPARFNISSNALAFVNSSQKEKFTHIHSTKDKSNYVSVKKFEPNHISFTTNSNADNLFVLMQQYFPGWNVFVDGKKAEIIVANYLFNSVLIPKGIHNIDFIYSDKKVRIAFFVSAVLFICCLIYITLRFFFQNPFNRLP